MCFFLNSKSTHKFSNNKILCFITMWLKFNLSVDGEVISSIGNGLCVLIGIKRDDGAADIEYM